MSQVSCLTGKPLGFPSNFGASGGIRTLTDFQDPPDFKSGAAADYATEAYLVGRKRFELLTKRLKVFYSSD